MSKSIDLINPRSDFPTYFGAEVYAANHGYRNVFLADDNFTAYRSRAKELLQGLKAWNDARDRGHVSFVTQVSIDAAKDDELLRMCAEAGLDLVFIGIETPNESALKETKKRQSVGVNLADSIGRFLDHGIGVTGGMIVGFDNDGPDIFDRQYRFGMSVPIPIFSLGALVAPAATPPHAASRRKAACSRTAAKSPPSPGRRVSTCAMRTERGYV